MDRKLIADHPCLSDHPSGQLRSIAPSVLPTSQAENVRMSLRIMTVLSAVRRRSKPRHSAGLSSRYLANPPGRPNLIELHTLQVVRGGIFDAPLRNVVIVQRLIYLLFQPSTYRASRHRLLENVLRCHATMLACASKVYSKRVSTPTTTSRNAVAPNWIHVASDPGPGEGD